eukprot:GDKI01027175.1.p1 GENE.GDKI01027175.1~~GDKI01027175.1.p1  ORF type:complete len:159 (-),score=28.85 GDKI01027175.1:59-535(-)
MKFDLFLLSVVFSCLVHTALSTPSPQHKHCAVHGFPSGEWVESKGVCECKEGWEGKECESRELSLKGCMVRCGEIYTTDGRGNIWHCCQSCPDMCANDCRDAASECQRSGVHPTQCDPFFQKCLRGCQDFTLYGGVGGMCERIISEWRASKNKKHDEL